MTKNSSRQLEKAVGGVDRISNLPDSIRHHIFSFLDTQSAVQTCVLSKQWESAWKHVHALNLDVKFDEFSRYEKFVDKVLSLRYPLHVSEVSCVTHAWPNCPIGSELSLFKRILRYTVYRGAQHLDLRRSDDSKNFIPLMEFLYRIADTNSVRTLQLVRFDLNCRHQYCRFQFLTKLELNSCRVLIDWELEPFPQFRCLNDLVLEYCSWVCKDDDVRASSLRIFGLKLVKLSLRDLHVYELEIFAPKLKSLYVEGYIEFSKLTLPSLICADIRSICIADKDPLVSMFNSLHNVEFLTLCDDLSMEVLDISSFLQQQPNPFTKLKKLHLQYVYKDEIPYKVLDNYFFDEHLHEGINIQIVELLS